MARHPRLIVPGVALHARHRGNDGQNCFRQDNDRLVYLSLLRDYARHSQCAIHAYCLMPNHVHLLITPAQGNSCALLMRDLGRCYSAYFNRRYERWGALWEHSFRSCLVDSAAYVITCYRYIERNPVRGNIVASPDLYRWSSYAGNAALRHDELLTPHEEYLALAFDDFARQRAYRQLVNEEQSDESLAEMREATDTGNALIGDALRSRLEAQGMRLAAGKRGRHAQRDTEGQADPRQLALLTE